MKFVAGIDGGGTKTTLLCKGLDCEFTKKQTFGAFNINSIGKDEFKKLLESILLYLKSMGDCEALCIGAAGSSNSEMRELINSVFNNSCIKKWKLVGDNDIAFFGALDGQPGLIAICGTGSIVMGKDNEGEYERAGGWGHLIGDEGSAYGIVRDSFVAISKMLDGIGPDTSLLEKFGFKNRKDIISFLYSSDKSSIASLAPVVEEAALNGDAVAVKIIRENVRAIGEQIIHVAKKLVNKRISFSGGMVNKDTYFRKILIDYLSETMPELDCILPVNDAVTGAVLMAREMLNV